MRFVNMCTVEGYKIKANKNDLRKGIVFPNEDPKGERMWVQDKKVQSIPTSLPMSVTKIEMTSLVADVDSVLSFIFTTAARLHEARKDQPHIIYGSLSYGPLKSVPVWEDDPKVAQLWMVSVPSIPDGNEFGVFTIAFKGVRMDLDLNSVKSVEEAIAFMELQKVMRS